MALGTSTTVVCRVRTRAMELAPKLQGVVYGLAGNGACGCGGGGYVVLVVASGAIRSSRARVLF